MKNITGMNVTHVRVKRQNAKTSGSAKLVSNLAEIHDDPQLTIPSDRRI